MKRDITIQEIAARLPDNCRWKPISFEPDAITKTNRKRIRKMILAKCSCGTTSILRAEALVSGGTLSCGCYKSDASKGNCHRRIYANGTKGLLSSYYSMMNRCYNSSHTAYKYYGGKGVTVCDEWKGSPQAFYSWAIGNGWAEGMQIDKDIKGDGTTYSPETCLWVTPKQNANNRSTCVKYNFKGEQLTVTEISRATGVNRNTLVSRLERGKDLLTATSCL